MSLLFSPLELRSVTLPNRVVVSPMCQYSATGGLPNDWHLVHLGSRAVGGAGLVIAEASAVEPIGRISPEDTGIWSAEHVEAWRPITAFIRAQGSVPGIQLAHAGRKASTYAPFAEGRGGVADTDGGWTPVGPTTEPFVDAYRTPDALTEADIAALVDKFAQAARYALDAGFEVVEVHGAHGYLLHEFLSPLSNTRSDGYGGDAEGRLRFPLEVVRAVRAAIGEDVPLLVRLSASDWTEGGLTAQDSAGIGRALVAAGADLIDVSSGGNVPSAPIETGPGYQVPFAAVIRAEGEVPTGAVGEITDAHQAEAILTDGSADLVLLARELLRDPYWPLHAAAALGDKVTPPAQYERAF